MKTTPKTLRRFFVFPAFVAALALPAQAVIVSYTYDPAGRLISADHSAGKSISYAYDHAGNLVQWSQPAPAIVVGSIVGNQLTLAWPASPAGFVLESSPALGAGAAWSTNVGATPASNGNLITVTLPVGGATQFYRLKKP